MTIVKIKICRYKTAAFLITNSIRYKLLLPLNLLLRLFPLYKQLIVTRVLSVPQYVEMYPNENEITYIGGKREVVYSAPRYNDTLKMLERIQVSALYVARLSHIRFRAGTNALITPHGYSLSDMFVDDVERRIVFPDSSFFGILYPNRIISVMPVNLVPIVIVAGVLLSNGFAFNYYHFTLEILPCLMHLDGIPVYVPLLVDERMIRNKQFRDLLAIFAPSRPIEVLSLQRIYEIRELYVPRLPNYIVPNTKGISNIRLTDNLFDTEALSFLRNKLLSLQLDKPFPKRIFLYRKSALRSFNQDEVWRLLQPLGFEKVDTGEFSILEQVTMFHQAECIVGGSGAAFTNLLYCDTKTHALIITNAHYERIAVFSTLGQWVGMDLQYIDAGERIKNRLSSIHKAFRIDPSAVLKRVESILNV